jgi:hypothetical protein
VIWSAQPPLTARTADWARAVPLVDQYVTALTVAEIERGVVRKEQTDPAQGAILRRWLAERVLPGFAGRVLPFDLPAARILAHYPVPEHAPYDDAQIAAVAEAHGMTVVTRNLRHFTPLGVRVFCPWEQPSST